MDKFKEYLSNNKIQFEETGFKKVTIGENIYHLVIPNEEGKIFTEDLVLITEYEDCDFYVFEFGGRYFYTPTGTEDDVQFNELKYIGEVENYTEIYAPFLGIHGPYEILNGSREYKDWIKKAKFLGCDTLGICEKNTLAGAMKFQMECGYNGITPIIGATYSIYNFKKDFKYDVKCYVKDGEGWNNILKINKEINAGNKYILESDFLKLTNGLIIVFNPATLKFEDNFILDLNGVNYFQLDPIEYTNNKRDKDYLLNLQKYYDSVPKLKPIFITDAYYLDKEDSVIKTLLNEVSGVREPEAKNQYFKSVDDYFNELSPLFNKDDNFLLMFIEAIENIKVIVSECDFKIDIMHKHLPKYIMSKDEKKKYKNNEDLFWGAIEDGLESKKLQEDRDTCINRIGVEYNVISQGKLQDYFLINRDQMNFCNENEIYTGPGRGSASGSLISYCMGITKVDPFEYDLIFERFLTEERAKNKIADIDIDHSQERRDEVKVYLRGKYGEEQCCSVGTYTALKLKGAIKDISKIFGVNYATVNLITTIIDNKDETLKDLFKLASKKAIIKNFIIKHPDVFYILPLMLNSLRTKSIHASAYIITPTDKTLYEWMPVRIEDKDGEKILVSEWEGVELEDAGFLKQDILGLLQLDKFKDQVDSIKEIKKIDIDVENIPLDDKKVFEYFSKGWAKDTFQFGTHGLSSYVKKLKPENIEDLIAAVSLYRPGAMESGFHEDYIKIKHGEEKPEYMWGCKEITKNTYGLVIYQEQIMFICQKVGRFNLTETDEIRRAMGKKKMKLILEYKDRFVDGAIKNGCPKEDAEDIWSKLERFAEYGFNRSHATTYAILGYRSMWFKVNYPVHFWSAAINRIIGKNDFDEKISEYLSEIYQIGNIQIKSPDINQSETAVKTDYDNNIIYWPLTATKQVGDVATEQIIKDREENGPYFSFSEFYSRHKYKGTKVNKSVYENLILAGAFDEIEEVKHPNDRLMLIQEYRKMDDVKPDPDKDLFESNKDKLALDWWWILQQKIVSGIAFCNYQGLVEGDNYFKNPYINADEFMLPENNDVNCTIGGYVSNFIERETKKGKYCVITLEINYQFIDVIIWPDQYKYLDVKIEPKSILLISGTIKEDTYRNKNTLFSNANTSVKILQ